MGPRQFPGVDVDDDMYSRHQVYTYSNEQDVRSCETYTYEANSSSAGKSRTDSSQPNSTSQSQSDTWSRPVEPATRTANLPLPESTSLRSTTAWEPGFQTSIELQMLTLSHVHRYPPGVVVIKAYDEHGQESIEEVCVSKIGGISNTQTQKTTASDERGGFVQSTAEEGVIERIVKSVFKKQHAT